MNTSTAQKIGAVVGFVLIGLPPGVCSILFTPMTLGVLADPSPGGGIYKVLLGAPWLIGLLLAVSMTIWMIRRWRNGEPPDAGARHAADGNPRDET
jgi:hypothetical protein